MNQTPSEFFYWGFIAHSSKDAAIATRLHRALESYRLPRDLAGRLTREGTPAPAMLSPIYLDGAEQPDSADLGASIEDALRDSRYLIVICSPEAAASRWINEEIRYFCSLGREELVLPLIVRGEPNGSDKPGRGKPECFPPALRFRVGPEGTLTDERSKISGWDLRKEGDGFAACVLKALGGMTGFGYNAFVARAGIRKRRRRIQVAVAAGCLLASAGGWWDCTRTKVAHFAQLTEQFGVPQGAMPVNAESQLHRTLSFRVESSRFKVRRVVAVNSAGTPVEPSGPSLFSSSPAAAIQQLSYGRDGQLEFIEQFSPRGTLLARLEVLSRTKTAEGVEIFRRLEPASSPRQGEGGGSAVQVHRLVYGREGLPLRRFFLNAERSPQPDADGCCGEAYRYDENRLEIETTKLDASGQATPASSGVAMIRRHRGVFGEITRTSYFGGNGLPVAGPDGWHQTETALDPSGNVQEIHFQDATGALAANSDGVAIVRYQVDWNGNIRERAFFGPGGDPVLSLGHRTAKETTSYDELGRVVGRAYFGLDGKPALCSHQVCRYVDRLDANGLATARTTFDLDGQPTLSQDQFPDCFPGAVPASVPVAPAQLVAAAEPAPPPEPSGGTPGPGPSGTSASSETPPSAEPTPVPTPAPAMIAAAETPSPPEAAPVPDAPPAAESAPAPETAPASAMPDSSPPVASIAAAEVLAQPPAPVPPAAMEESTPAPPAAAVEPPAPPPPAEPPSLIPRALAGIHDQPELKASEPAERTPPRLEPAPQCKQSGREVEVCFTDASGKPVLRRGGYAGWLAKFDEPGNEIERTYLDLDRKPVADANGVTRWTREYGPDGRESKRRFCDADGHPVLNKEGIAGWTSAFDERGNLVKGTCIGLDGELTCHQQGYAKWAANYDSEGRVTEKAFYGMDGELTNLADGGAGWASQYDAKGNEIERAYFGPDGQPARRREGYTTWRAIIDERGNEVERSFLGAGGEPAADASGVARWRKEYDDQGRETKRTFLDAQGRPLQIAEGIAGWTSRLDDQGNVIEGTCFDAGGQPAIHRDGYACWKSKFDELGNEIERAYFGLDGQPVANRLGMHRRTARFDIRGNEIESARFDAKGQPVANRNHYHRVRTRFDARGLRLEQAWFGLKGEPVINADPQYAAAKYAWSYNPRGDVVETARFGPDGSLLNGPGGWARERKEYDAGGKLVTTRRYNAEGAPVALE